MFWLKTSDGVECMLYAVSVLVCSARSTRMECAACSACKLGIGVGVSFGEPKFQVFWSAQQQPSHRFVACGLCPAAYGHRLLLSQVSFLTVGFLVF